ncbi:MAG: DUF799 family lipoprotein [Desulfobacterales bacterium]|nr:DUF799 family lipoprotein [Desulfobacterales bacterium]
MRYSFKNIIIFNKKYRLRMFFLVCICFIFGLTCNIGCGKKKAIDKFFNGEYKIDPYMDDHIPLTVAILPFVDKSKSQKGIDIVRKSFYNHFSSLPFKDLEIHRVDEILKNAGFTDVETIAQTEPEKFKEILNVDAVIYGTVSDFDKIFAGIFSQVKVGAQIKMYDTNGHFLWSGEHSISYNQGGVPLTPVGMVGSIIAAALNQREIQLLRACDDLFRDMVKTIPTPTLAKANRLPVIELLVQDSKGISKIAGQELKVAIKGSPRMKAWFDIGDFRKNIPMDEVEPGGYVGIYKIIPGDNIEKALVTGYLADDSGATSSWIDALSFVTFDTVPPKSPEGLTLSGKDKSITLEWKNNNEHDLLKYNIYRSKTPLTGFEHIGSTEFTKFEDKNLNNFESYFYKISASDKAGNESLKSNFFKAVPIPKGPIFIKGSIEKDTEWYLGSSPYIIDDTVIVSENATLTIEPGVNIKSKGAPIIIKGGFIAKGTKDKIISFDSEKPNKTWEGIVFDDAKNQNNIIEFCRIKQAKIGTLCKSSSLTIINSEYSENGKGFEISGGFSEVTIKACIIHKNKAEGMFISEGSKVSIIGNKIINNKGSGIFIGMSAYAVIQENDITYNEKNGILIDEGKALILNNNIYDNAVFGIKNSDKGVPVEVNSNYWGGNDWKKIFSLTSGKVKIENILDSIYPQGKSIKVPVLNSTIPGRIEADAFLSFANSPYQAVEPIEIDNGASLYIQPGVIIMFGSSSSIKIINGGIISKGNEEYPIIFTSSGSTPASGDYVSAVEFEKKSNISSFFQFCIFEFAKVGINIYEGSPEITQCYISNNSQAGIRCSNESDPKITYNTITNNGGSGGIECVGNSRPKINYNNFKDNAVSIQAWSNLLIDARNNYWGMSPPDRQFIWGDKVLIEPWLELPEKQAFLFMNNKK